MGWRWRTCGIRLSFNPFDPIQDTESAQMQDGNEGKGAVSTHSIRYRILKEALGVGDNRVGYLFQPIRSDTGY